jgi:hypothetical protein
MKSLALTLIVIVAGLMWITPVSAHTPAQDGSIVGELHIEPDDQPVANTPATLMFELGDAAQCPCTVTIGAFQSLLTRNQVTYTFPRPGDYQVRFQGQNFNIDLPVNIQAAKNSWSDYIWLLVGALATIGVIVFLHRSHPPFKRK